MNTASIRDKHGEQYTVYSNESDGGFEAVVVWQRTCVGQILCVITEDQLLEIGNIEIFAEPVMQKNGCLSFRPFQRQRTRNFRQLGLGSAMIEYLTAEAERLNVAGIYGEVTPKDAEETPYLVEFYKRHGFTIGHEPRRFPGAVATIYREMEKR